MCGINLILDKKSRLNSDHHIQNMNAAIAHRGPDDSYFKKIPIGECTAYLGYTLLRIQDLNSPIKEMVESDDGKHYLSFNGEIYNHKVIRPSGQSYTTTSDVESLRRTLTERGEAVISELNGMFAFVFIDCVQNKITIARDRHGIKPVYYFENEQYLIVSSEIKGILASGLIKKELNSDQINYYLKYKFACKPATFYQGVFELEEQNSISHENDKTTIKKWGISASSKELTIEQYLSQSVSSQATAQANIGLMLSGGVDSTLLLTELIELGYRDIPCYTVTSEYDKNYGTSDTSYAQKAIKQYGGKFVPIHVEKESLASFDAFVKTIDQPIADGAQYLTWLLTKETSKDVRVLLNGAGADELFAGYNRHLAFHYYLKYLNRAERIKLVALIAKLLPNNKVFDGITHDPYTTFKNFTSLNFDLDCTQNHSKNWYGDLMNRALKYDQHHYLISDVLMTADSASMANSTEIRVPYLDNDLSEYANLLEGSFKLKSGKKWLLKEVLDRRGGNDFTKRKKEGFGVPFGKWMMENCSFLAELNDSSNTIYDYISFTQYQNILKALQAGRKDYKQELWSLKVFSSWIRSNF